MTGCVPCRLGITWEDILSKKCHQPLIMKVDGASLIIVSNTFVDAALLLR